MPATKYAVTAGRLTSLASLESIKPANKAMDKLNKIVEISINLLLKNLHFP
jgi:hypothetical protein